MRALAGLAFALALGAAATARAEEPLIARLAAQSRALQTLSGEFTQSNRVKIFKQEVRSTGRFYFQRPRRIRWEYLSPDPSTMVLDGDKATLKTPGASAQTFDLQRDPTMRTVFDQLLIWIGGEGLDRARADWELAAPMQKGGVTYQALTPKPGTPMARVFARVTLGFDEQLLLRSIQLVEPSGDEKEIRFTKVERNGKLPANAFAP
jgi:outer membrane lipoprotein-sorting protein